MHHNIPRILFFLLLFAAAHTARGQALRVNLPYLLVGSPNIGAEFTLSEQFTVSGDVLWMPYLFKKREEVFRITQGSAELRYYLRPSYYYTHEMYDGFYVGGYAMYGWFNIGLARHANDDDNRRYRGWGMSGGVTAGYKFFLSKRFRLDVNIGLGYAHLQYNKYRLGGEFADYPMSVKDTKSWVGPTKFGVSLVYHLSR